MAGWQLAAVVLDAAERAALMSLAGLCKTAQTLALRKRIVLACAEGRQNKKVAASLGVDPMMVGKWRRRFQLQRLDGLNDGSRSGTPRSIDDTRIETACPSDANQQFMALIRFTAQASGTVLCSADPA